MIKFAGALIGLLFLLTFTRFAHADGVVGNNVLCDSCSSPADFANAAKYWYGTVNKGQMQVSVGNPLTGQVFTMWVSIPGNGAPEVAASGVNFSTNPGSASLQAQPSRNIVRYADLVKQMTPGGQSSATVSSESEDTNQEQTFATVSILTKTTLLFNVSSAEIASASPAFQSFDGGTSNQQELCPAIFAQEAISNPNFSKINETIYSAWKNTINSYFGHGILATVIFANGDVATFQINPLDPDACAYVKGTAKNSSGNLLPDYTPNIGGSSDAGQVNVSSSPESNGVAYSVNEELWLVCSMVGGRIDNCYVTPVKP